MPARTYWSVIDETPSTAGTTTPVTKLTWTLASPPANKDILIIVACTLMTAAATYRCHCDLYNNTTSTSLDECSFEAHEPTTPADNIASTMMYRWQTGATPSSTTFLLRFWCSTTGTATVDKANLIALQLETGDQYAESLSTATNATAVLSDKTTLTFDPGSTNDYYIIAQADLKLSASAGALGMKCLMVIDGVSYDEIASSVFSASTWPSWAFLKKVTLTSGSKTIKNQFRSDGTLICSIKNSRIVALLASNFDEGYYADNDTQSSTTTSGSYTDHTTLTQTPLSGDHLVLANFLTGVNSTTVSGQYQVDESGTVLVHSDKEAFVAGETQAHCQSYWTLRALAASSKTWKTQYKSETLAATTTYMSWSSIAVLQLFATPVTFLPYIPDPMLTHLVM